MKKTFVVLTFALMLVLAACGGKEEPKETKQSSGGDATEATTMEVKHELDEAKVVVPKNPEKVAVFDLGILDTIDTLGLGDKVVGLPQATVPDYLEVYKSAEYENLGSLKEPDFEKLHAAQPDLIIISARQADLYEEFKAIAPTIFVDLDVTDYLASFEANVTLIGEIFEKEAEVEEKLQAINEKVTDIQADAEATGEKALIVLGTEGKVSAYGPASRFGFVHDVLNIQAADEHIEDSRHGQSITFEYVLEKNPDIIYIIDRDTAIGNESSVKASFENELIEKTNAYKNDKLVYLDGEVWYLAAGGLESFQVMIDEVAKGLN